MHAKRVGSYVNRQRINWIQQASLEKTFTSVAYDIGVDEKTVRNIFNDYVVELVAEMLIQSLLIA